MSTAVIYAAKSTADEHGSISSQLEACHEYAARNGWTVDSEWHDEKASAYHGSRGPGLRGATARCAELAADEETVLLVFDPDRLARGDAKQAAHLVEYWLAAQKAGYVLASVTQDLRELLWVAMMGERAHQDSKAKSAHTKRGLLRAAQDGRYPWGVPPLGYRSVEGRLHVVEAEAQVVRRIFGEYLEGRGVNRIAAGLNDDGVRTRRGARFSARVILGTLGCRTYLGEIAKGDETLAEGCHEPIIDAETFDRAARLRASKQASRSGGRGRPPKRHLLAGLLTCPHGHTMLAKRWGHEEYYVCSRRHTYQDCDCPNISRRKVDETLLSHFLNRHYDEDAERARLLAAAHAKAQESRDLAAQADREEQEAEAGLARIRRDYQRGALSVEDWNEMRAELTEEAQASRNRGALLRARAAELEAEAEQVDTEAQLVARLAAILRAAAGQADDTEGVAAMRAALAATFERVTFMPGTAALTEPLEDGATVVLGQTELVPVLRPELVPGAIAAEGNPRAALLEDAAIKASDGSASAAGSPPPS